MVGLPELGVVCLLLEIARQRETCCVFCAHYSHVSATVAEFQRMTIEPKNAARSVRAVEVASTTYWTIPVASLIGAFTVAR
jgi:hypothetical protein